MAQRIVLASGSPRRRELLAQLRVPFELIVPDIDESVRVGERPEVYVRRLAAEKAAAVGAVLSGDADQALIIAADTTVHLDGEILGKPVDADDALRMLAKLSGRTHRVHTGLAVRFGGQTLVDVSTSLVTMAPIPANAAAWYVATGEPLDKAGGYAVQGIGGAFVQRVSGSVSGVVGLPLTMLAHLVDSIGAGPLVGR
jgi:septum formation protein